MMQVNAFFDSLTRRASRAYARLAASGGVSEPETTFSA